MAGKRKTSSRAAAVRQKAPKYQGSTTANTSILDFFREDNTQERASISSSSEQPLTEQDSISSFLSQTQNDDTIIDSLSIHGSYPLSPSSFQYIHSISDAEESVQSLPPDSQNSWKPSALSPFSTQANYELIESEDATTQASAGTGVLNVLSQVDTQISQFTTDNSQVDPIVEDDIIEDNDNISIPSVHSTPSHEGQVEQKPVPLPQPQFRFPNKIPLIPAPPVTAPQIPVLPQLNQIEQTTNEKLIPGKYAKDMFECIAEELNEYERWEDTVNAGLARYGSVVRLSRQDNDVVLFRMLDTWAEGGLIFSRCVVLPQEDIDFLLSSGSAAASLNGGSQVQPRSLSFSSNTETESIREFSSQQIPRLPDYEYKEREDETFLFAFSFAYIRNRPSPKALEKFIKEEQVVGVWPEWKEVNMEVKGVGISEINLATKFKADSIY